MRFGRFTPMLVLGLVLSVSGLVGADERTGESYAPGADGVAHRVDGGAVGSDLFDDVPAGHWADREIGWAVANGITEGRGGGLFDPNGLVNRAQIVTFLFRLADLSGIPVGGGTLGSASFDDVPAGHWADEEIGWAVANDITRGVGGGLFDMGRVVTRAQIATFMFRVARVAEANPPKVGVSSPLERCASPGSPGSGVLAVLAGTTGGGFYQPVVDPGSPDSCERIMAWWEQARRVEAERINRGEYPCSYPRPPKAASIGDAGRTHGPAYFVGCWPRFASHGAPGVVKYPSNTPPFVEAVWNCYKTALEGAPPGWDGYWWPTVNDCHYNLLAYGYPTRLMGIDPECAAESYTRRVDELLVGELPRVDGFYAGPNSWTNCSTRAERMAPDTGQTFHQRCREVIAAAAKDPDTAENIRHQAAVYNLEPSDYLIEWGNIVCGEWSIEIINNAEINGIPLAQRRFIAGWHARPEARCHQQVILNLAEAYLRGGANAGPAVREC